MAGTSSEAVSKFLKVDQRLGDVNRTLSKVKIYRSGGRLVLRGYFPPHPTRHNGREKRHSLALGIQATVEGLKAAQAVAKEIDGQLLLNKFSWDPWLKDNERPPELVGEWLDRLREDHWSKTPRNLTSESTWRKDYEAAYKHLPITEALSLELLREIILERSEAGSRTRKRLTHAFAKLANFAGLEGGELRKLSTYTHTSVQARDLPSDELVKECLLEIQEKDPRWSNVYRLLAIYGLRNHEVFRCRFDRLREDPPLLEVLENTKTGYRLAYPCWGSSWGEEFHLPEEIELPRLKSLEVSNDVFGSKVAQRFNVLKVAGRLGKVYNLRHGYARRTFEQGWPLELASRSMGHDVHVHHKTYQAFITEQSFLEVYRRIRRAHLE